MKKAVLLILIFGIFISCEDLVDDINEDPNDIEIDEVDPVLFLNGAQLANAVAQGGHLARISGLFSGQLIGYSSLYSNIYGYSISSAESENAWNRWYIGVITNVRTIRERAPGDRLLGGISKVIEAHAIGSAASLFGDVPYREVFIEEIEDPQFDPQTQVFNDMIDLLESAIVDLNQAIPRDEVPPFDIYHAGDITKWIESAYTLQARYYLQLKDYANAYTSAQNGISIPENSMKYIPRGDDDILEGDKNLFWTILSGSRTGDIGNDGSYLMELLDPSNAMYRGNTKTDETARFSYYAINEGSAAGNFGIIEQFEPQNLVSFEENSLILAEAGARTADFDTGLGHLNDYRAALNTGFHINTNYDTAAFDYQPYDAADFQSGGMENQDDVDPTRALLREIIEERYVSGFLTYMPFNDVRRLDKSDQDLIVPFPLNTTSATMNPQRLPYAESELFANSNGPGQDPGIFVKTPVNQ